MQYKCQEENKGQCVTRMSEQIGRNEKDNHAKGQEKINRFCTPGQRHAYVVVRIIRFDRTFCKWHQAGFLNANGCSLCVCVCNKSISDSLNTSLLQLKWGWLFSGLSLQDHLKRLWFDLTTLDNNSFLQQKLHFVGGFYPYAFCLFAAVIGHPNQCPPRARITWCRDISV